MLSITVAKFHVIIYCNRFNSLGLSIFSHIGHGIRVGVKILGRGNLTPTLLFVSKYLRNNIFGLELGVGVKV